MIQFPRLLQEGGRRWTEVQQESGMSQCKGEPVLIGDTQVTGAEFALS
jgi:hypothetical protein